MTRLASELVAVATIFARVDRHAHVDYAGSTCNRITAATGRHRVRGNVQIAFATDNPAKAREALANLHTLTRRTVHYRQDSVEVPRALARGTSFVGRRIGRIALTPRAAAPHTAASVSRGAGGDGSDRP
jgi:hypothetical protein